jgi:hypothetical protein
VFRVHDLKVASCGFMVYGSWCRILDFKHVWSFFFKPRRISVSSHKARNDHERISGRSFQTRYRFSLDF